MINELRTDIGGVNSDYYRYLVSCREVGPGFWLARGSVERVDSGEMVGGIQRRGQSREQALSVLTDAFHAYAETFPVPPHEWQCLEIRHLLQAYRAFNDELTQALVDAQRKLANGELTERDLHDAHWCVRKNSICGAITLARKLAKMSEDELISLMTAPEEAYGDLTNPWDLDDADSRSALFNFILEPSELVRTAHEADLARILTANAEPTEN